MIESFSPSVFTITVRPPWVRNSNSGWLTGTDIGQMDNKRPEGTHFVKVLQLISSHDCIRYFA